MEIAKKRVRRVAIAIAGGAVLLIGILAIPYPGPGWLIVFTGLAILATEFPWARRVLDFAKYRYDLWSAWLKRQRLAVRIGVLAGTGLVVVLTLWLLNVFGLLAGLFQISADWPKSPFVN
jgi:uncharacterized protein (TIGR02611 family)